MSQDDTKRSELVLSTRGFFQDLVSEACERRKIKTIPIAKSYLAELLEFYVPTANLFDEFDDTGRWKRETLAETFLRAQTAEHRTRGELLKKLGDRSLYISGFFGDSLQRKLVDVDYYADMGCAAYSSLASDVHEDTFARLYKEFASRFLEFAEVLTEISVLAQVTDEQNILRLYETFTKTGSDVARSKLIEKGLIAVPLQTGTGSKKQ